MATRPPLPVICDRCRAEGLSGEDPFEAFGALLDFEPVPRLKTRADGWDAEVQRAYIAALSLTGNDRAACRAVERSAFGVTQLLAHEGSDGFRAAREQAMAIAADERSRRLAEGLRTVAAEQSGWRPPDPPWSRASGRSGRAPAEPAPPPKAPAGEGPDPDDDEALATLAVLVRQYRLKLEAERRCRLAGDIAAADFYLRQITMLEVSLDVVSGDGMAVLKRARLGGGDDDLLTIAETPMSALLDSVRRRFWNEMGELPRPEYPPRHLLVERDGYSAEPLEATRGGLPESHDEQRRRFEARHALDAEAQVEWEARAQSDAERRRAEAEAQAQAPPPPPPPPEDGLAPGADDSR